MKRTVVKIAIALVCCVMTIIPLAVSGLLPNVVYTPEHTVQAQESRETSASSGNEQEKPSESSQTNEKSSLDFSLKCEHDEVLRYVFTEQGSTAYSSVCGFCNKCNSRLSTYSLFKGELVDKSYLEAIKEHSGSKDILPGEYYTVTATVPLGFYGYTSETVWLTCEVKNEDFIVRFHVEFRDEFKEQVRSIQEGQEITFRGRFYDTGVGFADCELIEIG